MKLTAAQKKKLTTAIKHITGECGCSASSKTCAYWRNVDRRDKGGDDWQAKLILKEIEKLV